VDAVKVAFGHSERERLEFIFELRDSRGFADSSDAWLKPRISITAGPFTGQTDVYVEIGDFDRLLPQLRKLYETLEGTASFAPIERQVGFKLTGDGKGHVEMSGFLADSNFKSNCVNFVLTFDQTLLARSISEVEQFLAEVIETRKET
jgi:hypothetical protein